MKSDASKPRRPHAVPLLVLAAVFLVTTVPYLTQYPFHWDGGQFVLGVHHFSVRMHQPHPPGYPMFIAAGKLLSQLFSAHRSLQLISAGFAAAAVLCLYALAWQLWRQCWAALLLALGLLLNPLLWFYRETCLTYTADALAGTLTALMGWLGLRRPAFFYWNALLLGLIGGFRPSLVFLLTPLLLLPVFWSRSWKRLPVVLLILAAACAVWYVPLIASTGGLQAYRELSGVQFSSAVQSTSYLLGAPWQSNWNEFKRLLHTVAAALNVMAIPAALSLLFLIWNFKARKELRLPLMTVAAWALPPFFFFSLIHYGQIGYTLAFLPAAYFLIGPLLVEMHRRGTAARTAAVLSLTILTALQASVFAVLTPRPLDPGVAPTGRVEEMLRSLAAVSPMLFSINAGVLRDYDRRMRRCVELTRSYPPEETMVLAGENAAPDRYRREWRLPVGELFRSLGAALPEYHVVYVPAAGPFPRRALITQEWRSRYRDGALTLPSSMRRVVFAIDAVPPDCSVEGLRLEVKSTNGLDSLVGEIEGRSFKYCGVVFQIE